MNEFTRKIGLGTVQFGLDYGISNQRGKISHQEVASILKLSIKSGIDVLDTARLYGDSEEVLGEVLEDKQEFKIVSKLPSTADKVSTELEQSLRLLKRSSLYAYLFHDFLHFENKPYLWKQLVEERHKGRINKIGFSLYYPEQLENLWNQKIDIDIVQIPYNIFDRRFEPYFSELKRKRIEVHVRSVFLQGLFFMKKESLSSHFDSVKNKLFQLRELAIQNKISLSALPLYFVLKNSLIDKVILGISSFSDLNENLKTINSFEEIQKRNISLEKFREDDENIILPFLWQS